VMMTRVRGADGLARRRIALLAHHGSEFHTNVRKLALVITFNSNPRDRSAFCGLLRAGDPNVVFCPARGDTSLAPRAPVQIHRHSPPMRHRCTFSPGYSLSEPANRTSRPSLAATFAMLTFVAAQAKDPVSRS